MPGGVIFIGGDPGIGKSTLLLQSLASLSETGPVLYVGRGVGAQVALRAQRLDLANAPMQFKPKSIWTASSITLMQLKPDVAVIDSVRDRVFGRIILRAWLPVAQVRECAAQLTRVAKATGITLIMVGHVTKEGSLAGAARAEHIVDTVLYFEGDTPVIVSPDCAIENRFGAV